jgi:hypothetical protein
MRAPVAEPTVPDAVRAGVSAALQARGALGGGRAIDVHVVEAAERPVAAGSAARIHRVSLVFEIALAGGASATFRGERAYLVDNADPLGAAAARATAFEALAADLATDAVEWILNAPTGSGP